MAVIMTSMAWRYAAISNVPAGVTNLSRLKLDRLQAELSRNMYSEQGFEALMRAVFFEVCHLLIVVSNCIPGSPHWCVASEIWRIRSRAILRSFFSPLRRVWVH